jgi:hypothetical protein
MSKVIQNEKLSSHPVLCYDQLQADLLMELYLIYDFASTNYNGMITKGTGNITDKMEISDQLKAHIYPLLAWWVIFREPVHLSGGTIFSKYLEATQAEGKSNVFRETLESWQSVTPGFYMTKTIAPYQRSGTLLNIVGLKRYTVTIGNTAFAPLKRGELLTGFLLPIGNNIYTSPVDLFHISADDAPGVTWEVLLHFHRHTNSSEQSPPQNLYLSLMKSALESIDG